METISEKTAMLIEPGAPLFRYQQVAVASMFVSAARTARDGGMSLAQIAALHLVNLRQHMRVGEIADALSMQLPGASKVVADLVTRGLCTRVNDPDDRRAKVVAVTEAGADFIQAMSLAVSTDIPTSIMEATPDVAEVFNRFFSTLHDAGLTKAPKP